mgnify:CR=1 FL=1
MSLSNVPALTIDAAGVALPSEADILAGVLADLNDAFGGNLNTALEEIARLQAVLSRPFDEQPGEERYAAPPPPWAGALTVSCSS